jgi:hypothetical protein
MRSDQVRKALQRSHAKFAELLVDEVAASLKDPSREELADELRELDLLKGPLAFSWAHSVRPVTHCC